MDWKWIRIEEGRPIWSLNEWIFIERDMTGLLNSAPWNIEHFKGLRHTRVSHKHSYISFSFELWTLIHMIQNVADTTKNMKVWDAKFFTFK